MLNRILNIAKYCEQKKRGEILVKHKNLSKISECQHDFLVHYEFDEFENHHVMALSFNTTLTLTCQSCLGVYVQPIDVRSKLVLTSETDSTVHNELAALEYELMIFDPQTGITMRKLIEEEIYLRISFVPRCEPCSAVLENKLPSHKRSNDSEDSSENASLVHQPFAQLLSNIKTKAKKSKPK